MSTRRRFLRTTLIATSAAVTPGAAYAFRAVEPGEELEQAYANRCTSRYFHDEIISDVVKQLSHRGVEMSDGEVRDALAGYTCPWCGCSVASRSVAD